MFRVQHEHVCQVLLRQAVAMMMIQCSNQVITMVEVEMLTTTAVEVGVATDG